MKTAQLVSPTLLARRIMYAFGRTFVFTNNYKHCHTVKCYKTEYRHDWITLRDELQNFLADAGVVGHTVKFTRTSIIVRIPK